MRYGTWGSVIVRFVAVGVLGTAVSTPAQVGSRPTWQSFDPKLPTGSPVTVTVLKADAQATLLEVRVPGIWVSTVTQGGKPYTRVEYPEIALSGVGYSQDSRSASWFDFPAAANQVRVSAKRIKNALGIAIPKPSFPEAARGRTLGTAEEMRKYGVDPAGARPGIPSLRGMVAVSRRNTARDLEANQNRVLGVPLKLAYPLAPAGYEGSDEEGFTAPDLIDESFYQAYQGAYRGTESALSGVRQLGACTGVEWRAPLLELNTATAVTVYTNLLVEVKHLQGTEDFDCPVSWDAWVAVSPFLNGQAVCDELSAKGLAIEASRSAHYLILTPREWRSTLDEFALWKQAKGLNVDFAYVGNDITDDVTPNRDAIDAYIENYHALNYCHGVYVLLVGDVDILPAGRSPYIYGNPDGANADSDHVYETIGENVFASVYVGRLPCRGADQLQIQLDKILAYERSPAPGAWATRVTLAANSENDDGSRYVSPAFPSKYAAAVNAIASYGGYDSPPLFEVLHAGAASGDTVRAVNQDVVDAINEGRGQVLYRGHGSPLGWGGGWDANGDRFTQAAHLTLLHNDVLPIVYAIACQNSRMQATNCLGRQWMQHGDGGAVAHWGATVNSDTGENHERAKGIFRALYETGFTRLGPALAEAERMSFLACPNGAWLNNTFCYMLLGDPEMTIRREAVSLTADGMRTTVIGSREATIIEARDRAGALLAGAFVNVVLRDGTRVNGFTGPDGQLVFHGIKTNSISRYSLTSGPVAFRPVLFASLAQGPRLEAAGYTREEGFRFQFAATPKTTYLIQGSPDLATWYDLRSTNATGAVVAYADPPSQLAFRTIGSSSPSDVDPGQPESSTAAPVLRNALGGRARHHYFRVLQEER